MKVLLSLARTRLHGTTTHYPGQRATHPTIRLLNVAMDGGHITLQWVEPHEQLIDDFTMPELVTLLTSQPTFGLPNP